VDGAVSDLRIDYMWPFSLPRWCGPCKILGPRLEKMVAKQRGKVVMAKVDIDDHTDLAIEYEVWVHEAAKGIQCVWGGVVGTTRRPGRGVFLEHFGACSTVQM
jgi:hypothetical protein